MKYTPSEIVKQDLSYKIPIYQRLFEWDTDNIVTLLDDLKRSFDVPGNKDYYIGMLTSTRDADLVDGQQRFTIMMLMGCVFEKYSDLWKNFLLTNSGEPRLYFASRPLDNEDLRSLIEKHDAQGLVSLKMSNGIKQIEQYIIDEKNIPAERRKDFVEYIYYHLCFFITPLPENYTPRDLNIYFERMNTSGKNLEQHEILKVKLLRNLDGDISMYMDLWNKLADIDTLLIRKRKDEKEEELRKRKIRAFRCDTRSIKSENIINGLGSDDQGQNDVPRLADISPTEKKPSQEHEITDDSRCALSFEQLLLQTLYRLVRKENIKNIKSIKEFFNPYKLLDTFAQYLPYEGEKVDKTKISDYMQLLLRGRLALDICFVRPSAAGYTLDMNLNEDDSTLCQLMMFQSMLYVSASNFTHYRWFGWLMDALEKCNGIPDATTLYQQLKARDDKENKLPPYEALSYGEIRYWFWRLDFYIWQHRTEFFKDDDKAGKIAENYIFRRNRSIEHVAPQRPKSESNMQWDNTDEDKQLSDSFGNLVMISQGLNSSLNNESFEVKKAHVEAYYNGAKSGSIESLKLLVIYHDYSQWNRDNIIGHGKRMYECLQKSFLE